MEFQTPHPPPYPEDGKKLNTLFEHLQNVDFLFVVQRVLAFSGSAPLLVSHKVPVLILRALECVIDVIHEVQIFLLVATQDQAKDLALLHMEVRHNQTD